MGTLRYRARLRSLDDTEDLFVACSVLDGMNPYIKSAPRSDGQEVDPVTGRVTQGVTTLEIIDWWGPLCLFPPDSVIADTVVASVAVTPTTVTMAVGATTVLTAVVRNAAGQLLTGKVVTWVSDTPADVSVGPDSGDDPHQVTITAESDGSAEITATCETIDADPVTVTVPVTGVDLVYFADKLDSGARKATVGGFGWHSEMTKAQVVVSSVNPFPGDTDSLHFPFEPTKPNMQQGVVLGQNLTELYSGFYLYIPDGTEGTGSIAYSHGLNNPQNNKFFRWWDGNAGGAQASYDNWRIKFGSQFLRSSIGLSQMNQDGQFFWRSSTGSKVEYMPPPYGLDPFISAADRGTWINVQVHMKVASSPTAFDGGMQIRRNGVTVFDKMDQNTYDQQGFGNYIKWGYLLGAANAGWTAKTVMQLTRFRMANSWAACDPDSVTDW
jgi:hypothetical protein